MDAPPHALVALGIPILAFEHEALFKASFALKLLGGTLDKVPPTIWADVFDARRGIGGIAATVRSEWDHKPTSESCVRPSIKPARASTLPPQGDTTEGGPNATGPFRGKGPPETGCPREPSG